MIRLATTRVASVLQYRSDFWMLKDLSPYLMKRIFYFLVFVCLAACKPPAAPVVKNESPSPSPTPSPAASAAPVSRDAPGSATAPDDKDFPKPDGFVGVWATQDEYKDIFNVLLFADGRAVSNWSNGRNGGHGERGQWHMSGKEILVFYRNGWTDRFVPEGDGFIDKGYSPGTNIQGSPADQSPATRVEGNLAAYSGVWRLNKEPDGSFLYVSLQSDGDAESTNPANGPGKWQLTAEGARITWKDGWTELITKQGEQFVRMAWAPKVATTEPPMDSTEAFKVGTVPSHIAP
ncbi:MAG: hypothetical protein ABIP97_00980 [Chthoniobacterales bacterium]